VARRKLLWRLVVLHVLLLLQRRQLLGR